VFCAGVGMREVYFLLLLQARTPLLFMVKQLHASANLKNPLSKILIVLCIDNFVLSSGKLHSPSESSAL
jgi:hypothetical protein